MWDTKFSEVLHLEANLQPGIGSVRCPLAWFLLHWILWLGLAMFGEQASVGFSGFSFEILATGPQ